MITQLCNRVRIQGASPNPHQVLFPPWSLASLRTNLVLPTLFQSSYLTVTTGLTIPTYEKPCLGVAMIAPFLWLGSSLPSLH